MTSAGRKLIILGIRGIPAAHGGFETFVERLAPYLRDRGWQVTVLCQGSSTGQQEEDEWEGIRRIHVPVSREGSVGTIEFDTKSIAIAKSEPGTILTLGYNTGFLSIWLRLMGRTNYINMDGLEWKRDKYGRGARIYLWLNERLAAHAGTQLIADHPVIAKHLTTRVSASRIVMIPYGSELITKADTGLLKPLGLEPDRFFTLIARPQPENSVLEIVRAFSTERRGAKLVVLGKYDRSHPYLAAVLDAASDEVLFPGPIYDKPLLGSLRLYSMAYLHGHRVGGTNPSLVEALGAGNAMIAHDNPFNRWVIGDAGLFFADVQSCSRHIARLIAEPNLRNELRARARTRWEEEFTWDRVLTSYERLLTGP
jgi:glycosyltransferase involved in cell wall biosynthesis